ncbi:MAG: CRISPR-associated helicase Cas3' [Candidatus Marinimicrobia bacterium]|nr:CRISPR-associated helicase Cas3' [Candidatus Neomarinimicrobiota bacterium]
MELNNYTFSGEDLKSIIRNYESYYAHLSFDGKEKETLLEHSLLVQEYFTTLVTKHQLESSIIGLIDDLPFDIIIREFILELFVKSISLHDLGKINPEFQKRKMQNENLPTNIRHEFSSGHSIISAYTFSMLSELRASKLNISQENESLVDFLILCFSYPILKHHASKLNHIKNEILFGGKLDDLTKFLDLLWGLDDPNFVRDMNEFVFLNSVNIFDNITGKISNPFPLFALLKLNYSLLTASDYYATTHFMNGWDKIPNDFGVFTDNLRKKIIRNIENSTPYNQKTYKKLSDYKIDFPQEKNNDNLNQLRQNLSVEIINGIRENSDKNLFYIEAPTGSGKTNLSMLALAEFLRKDIENDTNFITKVFYVFPFTTLITQTFSSLKETLGLEDDELVQIHSKAGFSQKSSDDQYGEEKENIIDYQFMNYPISLLSHIKFFDILKSNKKSINYLMHRLANSVVIIDELQAYSPKEWDKVIYFINEYSKYFNIKFILMSATLPKIDELLSNEGIENGITKGNFVYLNKNKDKYFNNPNFKNRVDFDFSMLNHPDFNKKDTENFLIKLWDKILSESKAYKIKSKDNSVHTIIEFIFKKTADEFKLVVAEQNDFFDEVFILSGTTLEPRRKEIISKLKNDKYKIENILLITTQVVEAGVDIDMDLGFKDTSLIDSDEQLAGRINRNINKSQCKLFLFNYDDASLIYSNDLRFKKLQTDFKNEEYFEILETKKFDIVYKAVIQDRNNHNMQLDYVDTLPGYLKNLKNLDFSNVHKGFKLIDDRMDTLAVFIPVDIAINISESKDKNFTDTEIDYLLKQNVINENSKEVPGGKIWELFEEAIKYKNDNFVKQKQRMIILQGLMSKYTVSISTYSKTAQNMKNSGHGEEKYGYYYLNNVEDIYDYETGFRALEFEDMNTI